MPPGDPVPAAAIEAFRVVSDEALAALESAMASPLSSEALAQAAE
jgi:hypothetical protein